MTYPTVEADVAASLLTTLLAIVPEQGWAEPVDHTKDPTARFYPPQ